MKIQVTQEDIDNGERGSNTCCAVALAVNRSAIGQRCGPCLVTPRSVKLDGHQVRLPSEVEHFIGLFDRWGRHRVEPFEFELEI